MVSVCVATHNGQKYIKEQLESILSQLAPTDEVVVSDDGSSDNTLSIISGINDSRVRVYQYTQPRKASHPHEYVCRNFQNALQHAKGDYIFLSDQDDVWTPNKVEVCIRALQDNDLVLHDFMHIDENGDVVRSLHYNGKFRRRNYFMRRGLYYGCAMAFRRCVLDYALPFPDKLILHDFWIGILAETLGKFYYEETPLLKYRVHSQNSSETSNPFYFKIWYRMNCLLDVIGRTVAYRFHGK